MTYEAKELSGSEGRPVELLQINYGIAGAWSYTTAEVPIEYDARTYEPIAMRIGERTLTSDAARATLKISLPQDAPVGNLFRSQPPSGLVTITVFMEHFGDNNFVVDWKGRVTTASWEPPWLVLHVENVFSSLQRPGLRRPVSAQCPLRLYGPECRANEDDFKLESTVSGVTGVTVTSADVVGTPANHFGGGYLEWTHVERGTVERRMIRSSNTATGVLTLVTPPLGLIVGADITIVPGCDHTDGAGGCAKFANQLNYGGFKFIPKKNPFGGSTIY
jgi:uncharacterized phage protein (TIGR02218 family)